MAGNGRDFQRQARDEALAEIGCTLDALAAEQRGPDPWERFYLVHALQAFFSGFYLFATIEAQMALLPHAERSREYRAPFGPALISCDLAVLRKVYEEAVKADLVPVPFLGPVAISSALGPDEQVPIRTEPRSIARLN